MTSQNPHHNLTDDEVVGEAATVQMRQGSLIAEMMRRLKLTIESQTKAIEDFNRKAGHHTTWLLRLTWAIAVLTLIMAAGLGWQIYLALGAPE